MERLFERRLRKPSKGCARLIEVLRYQDGDETMRLRMRASGGALSVVLGELSARKLPPESWVRDSRREDRKGAISVLAAFLLVTVFAFVAFAVDTGLISRTQSSLQTAADAAALAAAQELASAVYEAAESDTDATINSGSAAVAAARQVAVDVAAANDVFVNSQTDVIFGKRSYDEATGEWPIVWGATPYNVVKVTVRRNNDDTAQPDGKLRLSFGWAVAKPTVELTAHAAAFVEARDIALVMDFSGSMNYDSQYRSDTIAKLGQPALESNLNDIWNDLGSPTYGNLAYEPQYATVTKAPAAVTWPGTTVQVAFLQNASNVKLFYQTGGSQTFAGGNIGQSTTYQGSGSYAGKLISSVQIKVGTTWTTYSFFDHATMRTALGLDSVAYPYPSGSWNNYIDYCRDSTNSTSWYSSQIATAGYRRKFGMKTLVEFWMKHFKQHSETPDLWKTRHYPFHAIKEGATLLCDFLTDLDYGDQLGLVTYDTNSRIESGLSGEGMPSVSLGSDWITDDYAAIDTIQTHKQAGHYGDTTNIGGGVDDAITLLQNHGRYGARSTIVLMTDGNANVNDPAWDLPADWNWNEITDYDGDGTANYTTSDPDNLYAIGKAKEAADLGFTVHAMSVGANADKALLEAIAFVGGGVYLEIPGGTSVSQMQQDVLDAFRQIAAKLPPPRLVQIP
jgi:Flp pilus assembly protein TadG